MKRIGVIGAGQMGTGIGIVASRHALVDVTFIDPGAESLKNSEKFIGSWCKKEISKQKMTEQDAEAMIKRIKWSSDMAHLSNVDFVVEAANEDFELKKKIF